MRFTKGMRKKKKHLMTPFEKEQRIREAILEQTDIKVEDLRKADLDGRR